MGADILVDCKQENPVDAIMRIIDGRGVDVAITP
jgi:alcohol dehydrogenase